MSTCSFLKNNHAIFSNHVACLPAAIVGRLGTVPLGAVGLSNLLFFFCTVFFGFLQVVATPQVANAVAQDNMKKVTRLWCCLWASLDGIRSRLRVKR